MPDRIPERDPGSDWPNPALVGPHPQSDTTDVGSLYDDTPAPRASRVRTPSPAPLSSQAAAELARIAVPVVMLLGYGWVALGSAALWQRLTVTACAALLSGLIVRERRLESVVVAGLYALAAEVTGSWVAGFLAAVVAFSWAMSREGDR